MFAHTCTCWIDLSFRADPAGLEQDVHINIGFDPVDFTSMGILPHYKIVVAAGGVCVGVFGIPNRSIDLVDIEAREVVLVAVHHRRVASLFDAFAEGLGILGKLIRGKIVCATR